MPKKPFLVLALCFPTTSLCVAKYKKPSLNHSSKHLSLSRLSPQLYGSVDLRHQINSYYDELGEQRKQDPALHARYQLGIQLYHGKLDIYGTTGIIKHPQTRQIIQRRPQFAMDIHWLNHQHFTLTQFNIIHLPFNSSSKPDGVDPRFEDLEDFDLSPPDSDHTIYVLGLQPVAKTKIKLSDLDVPIRFGANLSSSFYSRPQYTKVRITKEHSPWSLTDKQQEETEEIEDFAAPLHGKVFFGLEFRNPSYKQAKVQITAYTDHKYAPEYWKNINGVSYRYKVMRNSYYKVRCSIDLSSRTKLINDFYQFYKDIFATRQTYPYRRYRNIARLVYSL